MVVAAGTAIPISSTAKWTNARDIDLDAKPGFAAMYDAVRAVENEVGYYLTLIQRGAVPTYDETQIVNLVTPFLSQLVKQATEYADDKIITIQNLPLATTGVSNPADTPAILDMIGPSKVPLWKSLDAARIRKEREKQWEDFWQQEVPNWLGAGGALGPIAMVLSMPFPDGTNGGEAPNPNNNRGGGAGGGKDQPDPGDDTQTQYEPNPNSGGSTPQQTTPTPQQTVNTTSPPSTTTRVPLPVYPTNIRPAQRKYIGGELAEGPPTSTSPLPAFVGDRGPDASTSPVPAFVGDGGPDPWFGEGGPAKKKAKGNGGGGSGGEVHHSDPTPTPGDRDSGGGAGDDPVGGGNSLDYGNTGGGKTSGDTTTDKGSGATGAKGGTTDSQEPLAVKDACVS